MSIKIQESAPQTRNQTVFYWIIGILSVAIPVVVALLLFLPKSGGLEGFNVYFLPHLNAVINSATAICLITGYILIKKGNMKAHRMVMISAFVLSTIFLINYVIY